MVEAIMMVAGTNCFEVYGLDDSTTNNTYFPLTLDQSRPLTAPRSLQAPDHDWAGVTGTWRRSVSFMDYRDLMVRGTISRPYTYNRDQFYNMASTVNSPTASANFEEAVRLLTSEFRIRRVGDPENDDPGTRYPTLYIEGLSEGGGASSHLI
jgi:hypothetical protein